MQSLPAPTEIESIIQRPRETFGTAAKMPFLEVSGDIASLFQHIRNDGGL